jgi:hypothetical protein
MRDKVTWLFSILYFLLCSLKKRQLTCLDFATAQKRKKKSIGIFRMLKHLSVNRRFIGKPFKRYKETDQEQPKKKTDRKRTVRTKNVVKKVQERFRRNWDRSLRTILLTMIWNCNHTQNKKFTACPTAPCLARWWWHNLFRRGTIFSATDQSGPIRFCWITLNGFEMGRVRKRTVNTAHPVFKLLWIVAILSIIVI